MLALGVVIAAFELRFEREGAKVPHGFHEEWEAAIARWWELAALDFSPKGLGADGLPPAAEVARAASAARMFRVPPGFLI
jgi:hypothetical protein